MLHFDALRATIAPWLILTSVAVTGSLAGPIFDDPAEDTFGAPNTPHDIARIDSQVSSSSLVFVVDFYGSIAPPSTFAANSVVGFIDIDLDQNALTGTTSKKTQFSPIGDSQLGTEFYIDLFSERFHVAEVEVVDTAIGQPVGMASASYGASTLSVVVPLELLGSDPLMNYGIIVGDFLDMSDEAPNNGVAFTIPEPSAIVVVLIILCFIAATRYRPRPRLCFIP